MLNLDIRYMYSVSNPVYIDIAFPSRYFYIYTSILHSVNDGEVLLLSILDVLFYSAKCRCRLPINA